VEEFFPKVSTGIFLSVVSNILEGNSAVLVIKKGKVVSVVTKRDLMTLIKDQYAVFFPKVVVG